MNQTPYEQPGPDINTGPLSRLSLVSESRFVEHPFTDLGLEILQSGNITWPWEAPEALLQRVYASLSDSETRFSDQLYDSLSTGAFVLSTPILTNAGRYNDKPLSACTVPSLNWGRERHLIEQQLTQLRLGGMGTGFNFDELEDPIAMIKKINDLSVQLQTSGQQDRPVGNMGVLSIYHPRIFDYIRLKTQAAGHDISCFNISVNIDAAFMQAVEQDAPISLWDGRTVKARELMYAIAEAAHECADPGLVFLDRMNADNPTPLLAPYTATAPCGEVWLAPGETCQFGSLNLGLFVSNAFGSDAAIDYDGLQAAVSAMVRTLDNALDISIRHYDAQSSLIMNAKRKIGVGVCWFADMLLQLGAPYGSQQSLAVARDVMSFINYHSKVASMQLAQERWAFGAFHTSRYMADDDSHFLARYAWYSTSHVTSRDWQTLQRDIRQHGIRHASTTALPPTGRSAMLYWASQQIEPYFMMCDNRGRMNPLLLRLFKHRGVPDALQEQVCREKSLQSLQYTSRADIAQLCVTALTLDPFDHLTMVAAFQKDTDEAVSKTVNLPSTYSVEDVMDIYLYAWELGLKGITVYRQGSKSHEPMKLS